jgi:type II secretory pathway pseudopilin PulG
MKDKSRFSMLEIFIVLAIVMIVAPIVRPKMLSAAFQPITGIFHHASR